MEMETSSHIPVFLSLQTNLTLALGIDAFAFAWPLHSSNSLNISNIQKLCPKCPSISLYMPGIA